MKKSYLIQAFLLLLSLIVSTGVFADSYEQGKSAYLAENYSETIKYWSLPELEKNAQAQFGLGVIYMRGIGVEKDTSIGVKYYAKASKLGLSSASYNLGLAYYMGNGVDVNYQKAKQFWQRAAKKDHVTAQYNLAALLWNGDDQGRLRDRTTAIHWFRKAVNNGSEEASVFLSTLFDPMTSEVTESGSVTTKQPKLTPTQQQYNLGKQAALSSNYKDALEYWLPLAEQGHGDSQYRIASLYEKGQGVEKSMQTAIQWYRKSAESGFAEAQYRVGMYHYDEQPEKNIALAIYWLQSAADNGHVQAQDVLDESR